MQVLCACLIVYGFFTTRCFIIWKENQETFEKESLNFCLSVSCIFVIGILVALFCFGMTNGGLLFWPIIFLISGLVIGYQPYFLYRYLFYMIIIVDDFFTETMVGG